MKVSEAFPSNYLKASDLEGRNIPVQINFVEMEKLGDDRKMIVYFVGKKKGMVCNKTNSNTIAAAYGDDTEDWSGQPLVLFPAMVDFQGRQVEALRVKVPPRTPKGDRRESAPRSSRDDFVDRSPNRTEPDRRDRDGRDDNDDRGRGRNTVTTGVQSGANIAPRGNDPDDGIPF